jgi:hypothetical protein
MRMYGKKRKESGCGVMLDVAQARFLKAKYK